MLGSAGFRPLGMRFRFPRGEGMDVCRDWCVLSCRGLCVDLITHPGGVLPTVECRCVCSRNFVKEEAMAPLGCCCAKSKKKLRKQIIYYIKNSRH